MKEKAKSNEPIKQEGEFKVKKKTPKKLVDSTEGITKVSIKEPLVEVPAEITKVVIPAEEVKADEPVQIGEIEEVENFIPIKEVTEEKIAEVKAEVKEALRDEKVLGKALPENIEKLVSFMEDTGGTIEDYTRLNADYSSVDDVTLLKEYYKQEKPYLATQKHAQFQESTKQLFNDSFEGFDIKVGDKSYKYNIQNRDKIAENQSNINNLVGKFLDADGNVSDTKGYHKAMYAADNVDKIASHFYEQGKADAVKDVLNKSKNLTSTKARTQQGDVFVGGFKVKAMSGLDSTKLKIKTKKFN